MGKPLAPKPVILKVVPAGGGSSNLADVVTYKISSLGPPQAADVTCLQGNLISKSTLPLLKIESIKKFQIYYLDKFINPIKGISAYMKTNLGLILYMVCPLKVAT